MAGKMLVINEWIFHDLQGQNGRIRQAEAFDFLTAFNRGNDRIAVLYGSEWMRKFHALIGSDYQETRFARKLMSRMIINPNKCVIIQAEDAENAAPEDAVAAAPGSDIYLIQIYYASGADLLITTDAGLHDAFAAREDVNVICRAAFLEEYLRT